MNIKNSKSVCVIGSGVAGLVTAKTLMQDGFDVQIMERDSHLGGTWAPSRTYPGLRTNNSRQTYEFSDFSYPDNTDVFPTAEQVRAYLEAYADHFDVRSRILFKKEVIGISQSTDDAGKLIVKCRSNKGMEEELIHEYDFVAVCNGVFHLPKVPEIEGRKNFHGRILHSSEVTEATYKTDQKVVVIGGGKSAFDCASYAAKNSLAPTLVYRRPQWMAPRFLPGGKIPGDWLVTSRLMAFFLRYHHSGVASRVMHIVGIPIVRLWWLLIAFGWRKDLQMPAAFQPKERLPSGIEKIGVGGDFYAAVNDGTAQAVCGSVSRLTSNGVELDNGQTVLADLIIFATGWEQSISFLSEELRQEIAGQGYLRLFRHILPPKIQNIGFVGYASSFSCQLTAEIGAHWLSEHFLGALNLPTEDNMNLEIDRAHEWANEYLPIRGTEGFVGPYISNYVDDLMNDLRLKTRRLDSFISEYMTAFRASRFSGLAEERRKARIVTNI